MRKGFWKLPFAGSVLLVAVVSFPGCQRASYPFQGSPATLPSQVIENQCELTAAQLKKAVQLPAYRLHYKPAVTAAGNRWAAATVAADVQETIKPLAQRKAVTANFAPQAVPARSKHIPRFASSKSSRPNGLIVELLLSVLCVVLGTFFFGLLALGLLFGNTALVLVGLLLLVGLLFIMPRMQAWGG